MLKYLVLDVDGTLTDGKIYMGPDGEVMKAFSVKDGYVFKYILKPRNITPIVITARSNLSVQKRCDELGITNVHQGVLDKASKLKELVGEDNLKNCAYFGDDIMDLECMLLIKNNGGIIGCPQDAIHNVIEASDYICKNKAGEGALREFVEWLLTCDIELPSLEKKIQSALDYLLSLSCDTLEGGKHLVNDDFYYSVQSYKTKPFDAGILESHRQYVDIQIMIKGQEVFYLADPLRLHPTSQYDEEKDLILWEKTNRMAKVILQEGDYIILYPENAHMGAISVDEEDNVIKIVGKVKV